MADSDEPFHRGEREVQARAGVAERIAVAGRHAIRAYMPEQHRDFFEQLPFVVVGSVDDSGQPWASVLAGYPGFMEASADLLRVNALPLAGDPLVLAPGRSLGLLGIEPHTRRRNRMNGIVESVDGSGFSVRVQQSFGNCPKYIHQREASYFPRTPGEVVRSSSLDAEAVRMLRAADTFFIATSYPEADGVRSHGVDVSHRGGPAGFIRVEDGVLKIPDYVGNNYFNTLGNLAVNPRSGVLVMGIETGDSLYLGVSVSVIWAEEERGDLVGGERLLVLHVESVVRLARCLKLTWREGDFD